MDAELSHGTGGVATSGSKDVCHYDSYYYEHCCGSSYGRTDQWLGLFRRFADRIVEDISPESVLDAGCAMGLLVEALHDRGVDSHGIDISEFAIGRVHESVRNRCTVGSILEPFGRRFDLIVTIEVLEHLKPEHAERVIENFCAHADDVLFSSTPFDYKEASHFNVQPPEYWASLFARHGFYRDVDHDASYLTRWAVRFRKQKLIPTRLVAGYERTMWRLIQENLGARESLMEHQDALIRSESSLAEATSRNASLELASKDFDAKLTERYAAEAALASEFNATVKAWSDHVLGLDDRIRHLVQGLQDACVEIDKRDRKIAESDVQCVEFEQKVAEYEQKVAELERVEEPHHLNEVLSSQAWRLAQGISRLRRYLAPDGSKRRRALKAILDRGSNRVDAAHDYGANSGGGDE